MGGVTNQRKPTSSLFPKAGSRPIRARTEDRSPRIALQPQTQRYDSGGNQPVTTTFHDVCWAARSVAGADAFGAPGQRLHDAYAAYGHAGLVESGQEIEQKVVEDLLGEGLLSREPEC